MGKINRMSAHLANMIAAGEVVERPSSVVKELVENAIDANSTEIKIYLKNGGLEEIKIVDNGDGMDSDDVVMAFLPHATSKIKSEYDLHRISTLGFRGEAIASIASVSEMIITSSVDGVNGYYCRYKAGEKKACGVIHSNKGTTVEVKGLFFNTPARLKYMKTAKSELSSIMFFVDRIAMAHKNLRFTVYHDDKLIFNTTGSNDYKTLIGEIYGIEAAKNVITSKYALDGYKANIVLVKPSIYRANKLEITMICNGRYVKNYNITNSVCEAFSTYLPINKYPIAILYFDIDPLLVDVNVHPSKTEIKISNEEDICNKLKQEVRLLLEDNSHIPSRVISDNKEVYKKESIFNNPNFFLEEDIIYPSQEAIQIKPDSKNDVKAIIEDNSIATKNEKIEEISSLEVEKKVLPYMEYVGTIFGTYLIFQNEEGMLLVDQHAAAERINYEKNYELLASPNQPISELLIPISLSFTKKESLYIEQNIEEFEKIGFYLEAFGDTDYVIRKMPLWAKLDNAKEIIYDILSNMISNRKIDIMYFRDHIAKQISCKESIKANHHISRLEIDNLIKELNKCKNPYTCPHGRPTIIKLGINEIERMFERIQK